MSFNLMEIFILVLLILTSTAILISSDWRASLIALAVQYVGVMLLVSTSWPLSLALVILIVGWMAGAVLGLTQMGGSVKEEEASLPSGRIFRLIAAGLVLLFLFSIAPDADAWLPQIPPATVQAGLLLCGMGLLQVGMTSRPFRITLGLLTVLSGFEVLYAGVEVSILVAGLLAVVTLVLAWVGSYLVDLSEQEGSI